MMCIGVAEAFVLRVSSLTFSRMPSPAGSGFPMEQWTTLSTGLQVYLVGPCSAQKKQPLEGTLIIQTSHQLQNSQHHLSHSSVVSACLLTVNLAYASFYSFPQALKHQFVMRSIRSYFIWLPQFQCCSS